MKNSNHSTLHCLLDNNQTQLGQVAQKVTELRRINQYLQTILSPELQGHCYVANLRDNCLVIGAENASWLTYLRFSSHDILEKLHQYDEFYSIQQLKFIIAPQIYTPSTPSKPPANLSENSARMIENTALSIQDKKLQTALLKLAKNGKS